MTAEAVPASRISSPDELLSVVTHCVSPVPSSRAAAQRAWAATPVRARLQILKAARHQLAEHAENLAEAMPSHLARTQADTLVAEVLPLLDACRFLERRAPAILCPRSLGRAGRPLWLGGVHSEIRRIPFGRILVIGPSNYPLFLPGVQALQALAAGNAVTWKPGHGGSPVARLCAQILESAGLPRDLLAVTPDTVEAAEEALANKPDKVVFTGSGAVGRVLLQTLAKTPTPSVMELSGCDSVLVLPSADLARTASAIAFGMRLNGSATCMAPRRLILAGLSSSQRHQLLQSLQQQFANIPAVPLSTSTAHQLFDLINDAKQHGGEVFGRFDGSTVQPLLVLNGTSNMALAQADLFAPVLTVFEAATLDDAIALESQSPLSLTTSIFSEDSSLASRVAARLTTPTILINDLIAPTADPRVPFGGHAASGFGSTRGTEGLLEMTRPQVVTTRRNRASRHYEPTSQRHTSLFAGLATVLHGGPIRSRLAGVQRIVAAARSLHHKS